MNKHTKKALRGKALWSLGLPLLGALALMFAVMISACGGGDDDDTPVDGGNGEGGGSSSSTKVTLLSLNGKVIAPETGAAPVTTGITTAQYTGTVAWKDGADAAVSSNFAANTVYKAVVTLTAASGYTFTGVATNAFTYTGAAVTNAANSGVVTITFPATSIPATLETLGDVLAGLAVNTADNPYTIALAAGTNISENWEAIRDAVYGNTVKKYVILDLSDCSATTINGKQLSPEGNDFNIIQYDSYIKGIILPDSLTSIGQYALCSCIYLTSVVIGNNVTTVNKGAFEYCSDLTSVIIGNSVTSIGQDAFAYCDSLTSVTFPDSLTSIVQDAFRGCDSLTSVTFPASVTSIGQYAFYECTDLVKVTFEGSSAFVNDTYAFPGVSSLKSAGGVKVSSSTMAAGTYTREPGGETWTKVTE
ncbi:MAG: leucine-rich repeat domain-containing protein [Treponematales bacterium]